MIYEFDPLIYPRNIWVYIGTDFKEVQEYFRWEHLKNMPESTLGYVQDVYRKETDCGGILIWFRNKKEMSVEVIAHESLHAALGIIDFIGGEVDNQNQEYVCYLTGWIAKCISEVKNKKK